MADPGDEVRELIRRDPSRDEHDAIRKLWQRHSIAEDNRDLPGLLATLTTASTCSSRPAIAGMGTKALRASTAACSARFRRVSEEADVTGTHEAEWLGVAPTGERLAWKVTIFFPWDRERQLFTGERVYTAGLPLPALAG